MMSDVNPYAAPAEWDPREAEGSAPFAEMVDETGQAIGIWRRGRILVMHKHARLPNRCVKSNQPTGPEERWRHTFTWCHWTVFLGLLVNLLIFILLYMVLARKSHVEVGVSRRFLSRRRLALFGGGFLSVVSFVVFIVSLAVVLDGQQGPRLLSIGVLVGSLVATIGGLVWLAWGSTILTAKYIDKHYVWLRGVHRDYLAMLPEWPGK